MDDLTKLKGVGKATAALLITAGITSFSELAAADAAALVAKGGFKPTHDVAGWIAQAKALVVTEASKAWRGHAVSIVLKTDIDGVGKKGETVTVPADDGAALRHAGKARRMLLSDLPAR